MTIHTVALGGNKRNWAMWDNFYASARVPATLYIDYAAHLKTRHKGLPFEFDGCAEDWGNYFEQESLAGKPEVGDIFVTHWLNEGTNVENVYVHVKRPAPAGTVMTVGVRDIAGATIGTDTPVALDAVGYVKIPVDALLQTNGHVQFEYTTPGDPVGTPPASPGGVDQACFAIFVDLFNAHSEQPCVCCVPKCEVPVPTPQCFTPNPGC